MEWNVTGRPLKTAKDWMDYLAKIAVDYPGVEVIFSPEVFNELRNEDELYYILDERPDNGEDAVFIDINDRARENNDLIKLYQDIHNITLKKERRSEFLSTRSCLEVAEQNELTNCQEDCNSLQDIEIKLRRILRERGWELK